MTTKQFLLPIASEITVDLFAGGGGASTGLEQALGRQAGIEANPWPSLGRRQVGQGRAPPRDYPRERGGVSDLGTAD